jgi:hypothetical protein
MKYGKMQERFFSEGMAFFADPCYNKSTESKTNAAKGSAYEKK